MKGKKPVKTDIWAQLEEDMKNPNFVKAVKEFIKFTT